MSIETVAKCNNNEYWRLVCETDAAWDEYCCYPSEQTWQDYVDAKEAEKEAASMLSNAI